MNRIVERQAVTARGAGATKSAVKDAAMSASLDAAKVAPARPSETASAKASEVKCDNIEYWTNRAPSYSEQNRCELKDGQASLWQREILFAIEDKLPGHDPSVIKVLDIGCGPGIFSVVLARAGYNVTAIDYTPSMIAQAMENAGELAPRIDFHLMDAENLEFDDDSFDVIVTRNVTWNLPHPVAAYAEWCRVLRVGGALVNFDANWYNYLYEDPADCASLETRDKVAHSSMDGRQIDTDVSSMESIALRVPLSKIVRPGWDMDVLGSLHMDVECDPSVYQRIWDEGQLYNYESTPMFKIVAVKR